MARTKNRRRPIRKKSRRTRKNKRRDQRRRNKKLHGGAAPTYGMIGTFNFYDSSSNPALGNGILSIDISKRFPYNFNGASMAQVDMTGKNIASILASLSATAYPPYVIRVEDSAESTYYAEFLLNRQDQVTATAQNTYKLYSQEADLKAYRLYSQALKTLSTVVVYFYQNGSTLPTRAQLTATTTLLPTTTLPPTTLPPTTLPPTTLPPTTLLPTTLPPTTLPPTTLPPTTLPPTTLPPTTLPPTLTVAPIQGQLTGVYTEKTVVL
jgi:hypothetical protein